MRPKSSNGSKRSSRPSRRTSKTAKAFDEEAINFLNVDLDIFSKSRLEPLVALATLFQNQQLSLTHRRDERVIRLPLSRRESDRGNRADHVTGRVGDTDDRVVKRSLDVHHAK